MGPRCTREVLKAEIKYLNGTIFMGMYIPIHVCVCMYCMYVHMVLCLVLNCSIW